MLALETIIVFAVIPAFLGVGIAHFQRKGQYGHIKSAKKRTGGKIINIPSKEERRIRGKRHTCFECRDNYMLGAISRNKTFSNSFRKRERRHLKRI